ncbi:hypothetical protein L3476_13830 [Paenibacillus thiaminolyticus]|uniref:hypothetical protein n=1 Tax=Paenibacillus thiaminolyticus TaxID=49283 RepID=UPI00234FD26A|nr:hypothetical protein [Paenibacillus thiaminolyticus]WCR29700.1 hypothetical protein L3476_13830 [Paenibacillus thiaminolyticus]
MWKFWLVLISIITAVIIQLFDMGNVGLFLGSVVSNIPILDNILTAIDFIFLHQYMSDGITVDNIGGFITRLISIAATLYTMAKLMDLKVPSLNDDTVIKVIFVIIAIGIHFCFSYITQMIYVELLLKTVLKAHQLINDLHNLIRI